MIDEPLFCVDMGTTNCRVWVVEDGCVRAKIEADFGVRNVVLGKTNQWLRQRLAELIAAAGEKVRYEGLCGTPNFALGAGMMTSSLGVMDLPHLIAPAGAQELAQGLRKCVLQAADAPPLYLVPGVRTGELPGDAESSLQSDLMRGEECLCAGLSEEGRFSKDGAILNLGSHWKWIWFNNAKQIARSRTTLTGELIHAAQSQTLIASALPQARPQSFDAEWLALGREEAKCSGLTRTLFCVRLLEQAKQGTPEQRLAFLYGAFIESEIAALAKSGSLDDVEVVCISGANTLAEAWCIALRALGKRAAVLSEMERDAAYLTGLQTIFQLANVESPADAYAGS
jgi:2-dehydro-3-deoxygalactonokinase